MKNLLWMTFLLLQGLELKIEIMPPQRQCLNYNLEVTLFTMKEMI